MVKIDEMSRAELYAQLTRLNFFEELVDGQR